MFYYYHTASFIVNQRCATYRVWLKLMVTLPKSTQPMHQKSLQ